MKEEFKEYSEYQFTDYEWLPKVPKHWDKRYLFQISDEQSISNKIIHNQNLLSLSYGNIVNKDINSTKGLLPESFDTYQVVNDGNIILRLTDLQNDHKSLRVGLVTQTGIITSAYTCLNPKQVSPKFMYYLLHAYDLRKVFYGMGGGLRQSIGFKDLKYLKLFVPTKPEQDQIVKFLDFKILKINKFIKDKKKEIELLKEQKKAVINQIITNGINPDASMKDSGYDWLGTIPKHWCMKRAKNMFIRTNRPVNDTDDTITCFRDGEVTLRKNRRTKGFTESLKETGYQGIRKGDLVIHQMDAFAGAVGVSDSDGKGTPVYIVCLPKSNEYNNYYYALVIREMANTGYIQSLYRGIRERSSDFRFETFAKQFLPIPPRKEQDEIMMSLNVKTKNIDNYIHMLNQEISLVEEYKISLISEIATGNVDVRNIKINKDVEIEPMDEVNVKCEPEN
jgi:type I restriction enzyme S subunit